MADSRPQHNHYRPSLMNQPTPPFNGAANAIYGDRGPQRAMPDYNRRKPLNGPPESLQHHIDDALARVPDLSPKQRLALRNTLMAMTRDISFIRLIADSARGPWSEAAVRGDDGWSPR